MTQIRLIPTISLIVAIVVSALGIEALSANEVSGQSKSPAHIQLAQATASPRAKSTLLLEQKLDGIPGFKVQIVLIEGPPGWVGSRHYHPGHVFGYVIEGTYSLNFDDLTSQTVRAGDAFYETPNTVMRSKNASSTAGTKQLVFQIFPEGQSPAISVK
jgi:quercetin dioxygenase-like cupin family protein